MNQARSFKVRCAVAILSGAILAAAFPPVGWRWLVLPGLAGLVLVLKDQQGSRARLLGFLHGFTAFGLSLSWLWNIFGSLSIVLWCVLTAFTVLFAEMQSRAGKRGISGWKLALFTAANWSAWEFIRAEIFPLKLPWMTPGLAIGPNVLLPWIGVYLVGMLVMFSSALLAQRMWRPAGASIAILLGAVLLCRPFPQPDPNSPKAVTVAGLQFEGVSLNEYLAGTREMSAGIDHVVWPEYAVPFDIRENERDWKLVTELSREKDITLTFGTQSRPGGGDEWRNIALTIDPSGYLGEHNKVHTVHMFDDGIPGRTASPVPTSHGMVGTPICFDFDYTDVARKMTASGAGYLVVPTMDAESWSARQHDQHAELARIRAVENGRWVFVCATSGISQIIDPSGHLHERLGAMEQGPISGVILRETALTFHTRFGWVLPWLVLGVMVVAWIALLFPVRDNSKETN